MHEVSLVKSLLEQLRRIHCEHPQTRIADVEIEVGSMAGVEPWSFRSAFEKLTSEEGMEGVQLTMHHVPVLVICQNCYQESIIENFEFLCPLCQGTSLQILQGDCVKLMSIDLLPTES